MMRHIGPRAALATNVRLLSIVGLVPVMLAAACSSRDPIEPSLPSAPVAPLGAPDASAEPADGGADASPPGDAASPPAEAASPPATRGVCAETFGDALTSGFGRIDGTVVAVVVPTERGCAFPNRDHVALQVLMGGAVYRMVVNVQSDRAGQDPRVRFAALERPLPPPEWADGWHVGLRLDYATDLGARTADFTPLDIDALTREVIDALAPGEAVSVYAVNDARPGSAHLVHRNGRANDGAIVVAPQSATPRFLLFHFASQTF